MTDAQRIYGAWTQMWNGNLDIADDILSPDFKAHLTADSTQPPAPVMDIASAKAWISTIRAKADSLHYGLCLVHSRMALLFPLIGVLLRLLAKKVPSRLVRIF